MILNFNQEVLNENKKVLEKAADDLGIIVENVKWETTLKPADVILIRQVRDDYKLVESGLSVEEYDRYIDIYSRSEELEKFYVEDYESNKKALASGVKTEADFPFDINISIEEAYGTYIGCDREAAKKINSFMYELERKADRYEADIREHYTGDLATQLGYDRVEYEDRAKEFNEALQKFEESIRPISQRLQEVQQDTQQTKYMKFANETVQQYEYGPYQKEPQEPSGPQLN